MAGTQAHAATSLALVRRSMVKARQAGIPAVYDGCFSWLGRDANKSAPPGVRGRGRGHRATTGGGARRRIACLLAVVGADPFVTEILLGHAAG